MMTFGGAPFRAKSGSSRGSYTVTETKAPAGHQLTNPAQSFTFTVDAANAGTVINGGKVVNRRIPGEVTWAKVETGTTTKLSGSEWKLEGPGGFNDGNPLEIADCAGSTCDGPDKDPVGGAFKLHVMDLSSGAVSAITDTSADENPSFAPNSRLIVYATQQQGREALMTATLDGKIKARLAGQGGDIREPDWGPFQKQ